VFSFSFSFLFVMMQTPVMSTWAVDDSLRIVADYFTQFVMVSEHNETL